MILSFRSDYADVTSGVFDYKTGRQNFFHCCLNVLYGGPQLSHQNQMLTANYKSLTSNSNRSQQIQIVHSKFKSLTANHKSLTANYKSLTANSNRSQQIQIVHSKLKSLTKVKLLTANYKLLTPLGVLQPAVQLV